VAPGRTRVVDLGAGTGISAALFLGAGYEVVAVEPNADMRAAADAMLGAEPRYRSVAARAEATGLPPASFDLAVAAQAFHWFDGPRVAAELRRILRPGSVVALLWNDRQVDSTPFLRGYEDLLRRRSTDYAAVNHRNVDEAALAAFFRDGRYTARVFPNHQDFDWQGLLGRALSSSYIPGPAHPGHAAFVAELRALYDREARDEKVRFIYDTRLFFGGV